MPLGPLALASFDWILSRRQKPISATLLSQLTFLFLNMNMYQMIHFQPAARKIHSEMTATIHEESQVVKAEIYTALGC